MAAPFTALTIAPANGQSYTFPGVIGPPSTSFLGSTDNAALTSLTIAGIGTGTQILTGTNNYAGATTITGGTLQLGTTGVIGSAGGTAVTVSGGAFVDDSTVATTGGIDRHFLIDPVSGGSASLASLNNYSGGTTLTAGTLLVGVSSATTGSPPAAITSGATGTGLLTVNGGTLSNT